MPVHKVKQGECLSSIAGKYGFGDPDVIYRHAKNAEFRKKRPNPGLLYPGDEIFIPEKKVRTFSLAKGQTLEIKLKVPIRKIQLDLFGEDEKPLSGADWRIEAGDFEASGKTGSDGRVEAEVPANVSQALLVAGPFTYELDIPGLDPLKETSDGGLSGLRARLTNLGYYPGHEEPEMTDQDRTALVAFQLEHDLDPTGELDEKTIAKFEEVHRC